MDEETREVREDVATEASGEPGAEEQREPEQIRSDIEQTREELGETVEALAGKADVKGQAKAKVDDAKQSFSERKDDLLGKAREASPESVDPDQAVAAAKENPLPLVA